MTDPLHDAQETEWDRRMREHEARLKPGVTVKVLTRPECYYCRGGEDEDGLIGTIEHVGFRNYRQKSEIREPGESDHIYWVEFPDEIPSQGTHHSHFAACELILLPLAEDADTMEQE